MELAGMLVFNSSMCLLTAVSNLLSFENDLKKDTVCPFFSKHSSLLICISCFH